MEWVTTSTILQRLKDFDDSEMWDRFSQRFRKPLISFIRRFGLSDDATDDVVQETLLAFSDAYRRGLYDPAGGRLSSWLFGIAYRQAANARRKDARIHRQEAPLAPDTTFFQRIPNEREARENWDADWERATLDACIDQVRGEVSENTFRAFDLIVRQGLDAGTAAASLQMTREAAYVSKHRILKRICELAKEFDNT